MSELTINSKGKIKFFGNIASFYALLMTSIEILIVLCQKMKKENYLIILYQSVMN